MIQSYTFFDGGTVEFEDSRSVEELIAWAFDCFGYEEPLGMDVVTVFQSCHPDSETGWFTTDVKRRCSDEIKCPDSLCFAYHRPGIFYFAEGGWGHHMTGLGNHPQLSHPETLHLKVDAHVHTVVLCGDVRMADIVRALKEAHYLADGADRVTVRLAGSLQHRTIAFSDPVMHLCLTELVKQLEAARGDIRLGQGEHIYYEIFDFT